MRARLLPACAVLAMLGLLANATADPQTVPAVGAWFADTFEVNDMGLLWAVSPGNGGHATVSDGKLHLGIQDPPDGRSWGSVGMARGRDVQDLVRTSPVGMWPPAALAGVMLETTFTATDPQLVEYGLAGNGAAAAISSANYRNGFPTLTQLSYGAADGSHGVADLAPAPLVIGHTYTFRLIVRPDGTLTATSYEGGAQLGTATLATTLKPDQLGSPFFDAYTIALVSNGARTAEYTFENVVIGPAALEALPAPLLPR